jgi:hypothetical protein
LAPDSWRLVRDGSGVLTVRAAWEAYTSCWRPILDEVRAGRAPRAGRWASLLPFVRSRAAGAASSPRLGPAGGRSCSRSCGPSRCGGCTFLRDGESRRRWCRSRVVGGRACSCSSGRALRWVHVPVGWRKPSAFVPVARRGRASPLVFLRDGPTRWRSTPPRLWPVGGRGRPRSCGPRAAAGARSCGMAKAVSVRVGRASWEGEPARVPAGWRKPMAFDPAARLGGRRTRPTPVLAGLALAVVACSCGIAKAVGVRPAAFLWPVGERNSGGIRPSEL